MPHSNFDIHDELNDPKNAKYFLPYPDHPNATVSRRRRKAKSTV
jgi:hypothetical protein